MTEITASARTQWSREEIAEKLDEFEQGYEQSPSQRQWAETLGIPRSALPSFDCAQDWLERKESNDTDPALVAFCESSIGVVLVACGASDRVG